MPLSPRFRHIVFPREKPAGRLVDVAAIDDVSSHSRRPLCRLPDADEAFLRWLFAGAELDVASYRPETLARRLSACLRALRTPDVETAREALERNPGLMTPALSVMLVGVTSFFRDQQVYRTLHQGVLPALAETRRGLYVWSAGCSDGSELYSAAMLLADLDLLQESYLLGTDCRTDAISTARQGRYPDTAVSDVPVEFRARYFTPHGDQQQVIRNLRSATRWRVANVLQQREPGLWDMIFCRNTSIYLRAQATKTLWEQLESSLRPGGVLVLGRAERPLGATRLAPVAPCIFRKTRR
jgi:chemotaxis protein methyltransferase CheR